MGYFLWRESFDGYTTSTSDSTGPIGNWRGHTSWVSGEWTLAAGRYGGRAFRNIGASSSWSGIWAWLNSDRPLATPGVLSHTTGTLGLDYKSDLAGGGTHPQFLTILRQAAAEGKFGLRTTAAGAIQVHTSADGKSATTLLGATANGVIVANQWHRIWLEWVSHSSTGQIRLYVDDDLVLSLTGLNLRSGQSDDITAAIRIGLSDDQPMDDAWYDNMLYAVEPTGNRIGDCRIDLLAPANRLAGSNLFQVFNNLKPIPWTTDEYQIDKSEYVTLDFNDYVLDLTPVQVGYVVSAEPGGNKYNDWIITLYRGASTPGSLTYNNTSDSRTTYSAQSYQTEPVAGLDWTAEAINELTLKMEARDSNWTFGAADHIEVLAINLEVISMIEPPPVFVSPSFLDDSEDPYPLIVTLNYDIDLDWEAFGPWPLGSVYGHLNLSFVDIDWETQPIEVYNDVEIKLGFVDTGTEVFPIRFKLNVPPVPQSEWNPYRPDIPPELAESNPQLYDYLREQAEIQREQHESTQAGDTTFPWQMIVQPGATKVRTLGSMSRFFHETYGLYQARYVEFSRHYESMSHPWVGHDQTKESDWIAVNAPGRTVPFRVIGWSGPFEESLAGKFGWVLTEGRGINDLVIVGDTAPTVGKRFTWSPSLPTVGVIGAGPVVGMVLRVDQMESAESPVPGKSAWMIPAGDWYIVLDGVTDEYAAAAVDANLDDINARLDQLEIALGVDDNQLAADVATLQSQMTAANTAIAQESTSRALADTGLSGQISDLQIQVNNLELASGGDLSGLIAQIQDVSDRADVLETTVTSHGVRLDDLESWRATAQEGLDNLTIQIGALTDQVSTLAFTSLVDAPASYTGAAGYKVVVKGDESGLELVADSGGDGWTYVFLTSVVTGTSNSVWSDLIAIDNAIFEANSTYEIEGLIDVGGSSNNVQISAVNPPVAGSVRIGHTIVVAQWPSSNIGVGTAPWAGTAQRATTPNITISASNIGFVKLNVLLTLGTDLPSDDFKVQAKNSAGSTTWRVEKGSYLRWRKLPI